jgi:type II secretory pathway component GspD/PulD (secretin)
MRSDRATASCCGANAPKQVRTNPNKIFLSALVAAILCAAAANVRAQATSTADQISNPGAVPATKKVQDTGKDKQEPTTPVRQPSARDKREAVKLFVRAAKLYEASQFEEAEALDERAATLDPTNTNYAAAAALARSHAVTAYVQKAAASRTRGDESAARESLTRALQLDPKNAIAAQHVDELAGDELRGMTKPLYVDDANRIGPPLELKPNKELHSFHAYKNVRQITIEVFKAYGIEAVIDDSMRSQPMHFDLDDVDFYTATRLLSLSSLSFYTPIDSHRVIVARDTPNLRTQYERMELETIYLPGLSEKDRTDVQTLAKTIFNLDHATLDATAGTLTIRALPATLDAFNATLQQLLDGKSQVMLDVKMYQLAFTKGRNTGAQLPQQMSVFPVGIEAQQIISQNQALVDQLISSGLVKAGDIWAILGLLYASGQVNNPVLTSILSGGGGFFGGGSSITGITPMNTTIHLQINSADTRALDTIQLRLGHDEKGTIKSGVRYPITTSSYSSSLSKGTSIAGLNIPGLSSSLSSLASSSLSGLGSVPMIEYQDIGLTLTATPEVTRDDDVALTLDLKLTSLSGQSVNSVPVLNNRSFSGVVTLKQGEAAVLVSNVDKEESKAMSGQPGLTDIPGLNNLSNVNNSSTLTRLVVVMTPYVVRGTQRGGHSIMMRVERKRPGS